MPDSPLPLTADEKAELARLADEAAHEPWFVAGGCVCRPSPPGTIAEVLRVTDAGTREDARDAVLARTALPRLLADLARVEAALAEAIEQRRIDVGILVQWQATIGARLGVGERPCLDDVVEALDTARAESARLRDLVRHQRGELHDAGLLTDEEYAALAGDHGAVARLEGYDGVRAESARLTRELAEARALLDRDNEPGPEEGGWCGDHPMRVGRDTAGMVGDDTSDGADLCLACEVTRLRAELAEARAAGRREGIEDAAKACAARQDGWNAVATRMCETDGFTGDDVALRSVLANESRCCARAVRALLTPAAAHALAGG